MPFVFDRVKETTTTTGTGTITLAGAISGHRTFSSVLSTGETCYYVIEDATNAAWECGIGTLASSTTLGRTTITASSNSGSAVSFAAGTKSVWIDTTASFLCQAVRNTTQMTPNPVDNGNFNIWQRGTTITSPSAGAYTADRWLYSKVGAAVHTISFDTSVPTVASGTAPLSVASMKIATTTADTSIAAGDYTFVFQYIEGYKWLPFAQQPLVLSFWAKASQTGVFCISMSNSGADRTFVQECTMSAINTWQQFAVYVPASPSAGTWNYTNSVGCRLGFALASGSTFNTTAGAWNTGNFVGTSNQINLTNSTSDYLHLSQVQIQTYHGNSSQLTTAKPVFQALSYDEDLRRCQRYYLSLTAGCGLAYTSNITYSNSPIFFPVVMRDVPSIAAGSVFSVNAGAAGTPTIYSSGTTLTTLYNISANWTLNAIVYFTGAFTADL